MNKYAAEKLAQEYYNLGLQYALIKEAGLPKEIIKKMIQVPVGAAGTGLGIEHMYRALRPSTANLSIGESFKVLDDFHNSELIDQTINLGGLGGGLLGLMGAGKAVDLAHSGGSKLLNKLRA